MKKDNLHFGILTLLIFVAAFSRLLPHPFNFTPLGGMALFGAAFYQRRSLSVLMPLVALWLSDLVLNNVVYPHFYPEYYQKMVWFANPSVYIGFITMSAVGYFLLKKVTVKNVLLASLSSSMLFYLITNFEAWLANPIYAKNFGGLMSAYTAGLPFYSADLAPPLGFLMNGILGDLFYCAILFGTYAFMSRKVTAFARA